MKSRESKMIVYFVVFSLLGIFISFILGRKFGWKECSKKNNEYIIQLSNIINKLNKQIKG